MSYITCEITQKDSVIKTVNTETSTELGKLIVSLENFRQAVNEILTEMIEDNDEFVEDYVTDDEETRSDYSIPLPVKPKKRKK